MVGAWQPPTPSVIQQQLQSIPTIFRYLYVTLDTTANYATIPSWYSNLLCYDTLATTTKFIVHQLTQQPIYHDTWYSNYPIPILWSYHWSKPTCENTLPDTAISMLWYLIQQPSLLLYHNWYSKLPYDLMILLIQNLIHYYTTIDTATLMLWYSWYNSQLYYYTWLDTTIFMLWHLIQQPIYYYTLIETIIIMLWYSWYNNLKY